MRRKKIWKALMPKESQVSEVETSAPVFLAATIVHRWGVNLRDKITEIKTNRIVLSGWNPVSCANYQEIASFRLLCS